MTRRSTCRANRVLVGAATILLILAAQTSPVGAHFLTERESVSSSGRQGNDFSQFDAGQAISAYGRLVAFRSEAAGLVPGDTNGTSDVFVRIPLD